MTDQEARLQHLKFLMDAARRCDSGHKRSIFVFSVSALAFFVFSQFQPSEFGFMGATVGIPQQRLALAAPLVLSFLYIYFISLDVAHTDYSYLVRDVAAEALSGQEWRVSEGQIDAIMGSSLNLRNPSILPRADVRLLDMSIDMLVLLGLGIYAYLLPPIAIGYFLWLLWQHQSGALPTTVTIASVVIALLALTKSVFEILRAKSSF